MGEPVTLLGKDGKAVTVYGNAQAAELLEQGYSRPSDSDAQDAPEIVTSDTVADERAAARKPRGKRPVKSDK